MSTPSSALPVTANSAVIEAAYESWLQDPNSVDPTWRAFFQGFTLGSSGTSPAAALAAVLALHRAALTAAGADEIEADVAVDVLWTCLKLKSKLKSKCQQQK